MNSSILIDSLVRLVVSEFPLSTRGIHGPSHWFGVRKNGLLLADMTGANNKAVELFALYHDCMRFNDGRDQEYDLRGAKKAYKHWKEGLIDISRDEIDLLYEACRGYTGGGNSPNDVTIGTCWDADRLDLGRIGIRVDPDRLCCEESKDDRLYSVML